MTFRLASCRKEMEVMLLNAFVMMPVSSRSHTRLRPARQILVPGVFGALLLPMMARALSEGSNAAGECYASSTTYLTLLAAPLAACWALTEPAQLLYGSSYVEFRPTSAPVPDLYVRACRNRSGSSPALISADRREHRTSLYDRLRFSEVLCFCVFSHRQIQSVWCRVD